MDELTRRKELYGYCRDCSHFHEAGGCISGQVDMSDETPQHPVTSYDSIACKNKVTIKDEEF